MTWSNTLSNQCVSSTTYTLSGGNPASGTYSGPGVAGTNFDASAAGTGNHTLTYTYTDANGCTNTATNTITVNPLPSASITGTTSVCRNTPGPPVTFTGSGGTAPYTFTYRINSGAIQTIITTSGNSISIQHPTNSPGVFTYELINVQEGSTTSCINVASGTATITVNQLPVPTINGPSSVCSGVPVEYTTEAGMTGYNWFISSGGTITAGGTPTDNSVSIIWNTTGAQTIRVNYSNAAGCTAAAPVQFNVNVNPLPIPTISGPVSACLNSTANTYITEAYQSNYTWMVSAGGTITSGGAPTDNTVTVTWHTAGPQTISVNYTNANGCTAASPIVRNVTVNPLPLAIITPGGATTFCQGGSVLLTSSPGSSYLWNNGATTQSISVTTTGSYSVRVTDANGCMATSPVTNVTVHPLPVVTISGIQIVCAGTNGNVYTTQPGMTGYNWIVSAGGTITSGGTPTDNTVTVTWNTAGPQTISVNYTNANGCTAVSPTIHNITVNPLPTATITGTTSVCRNTPGLEEPLLTLSHTG